MRISQSPNTAGRIGRQLNGSLRFFGRYLSRELEKLNFKSSFDIFELELYHPPLYVLPGIVGMEKGFMRFYETLPISRLNRKYKTITVQVQAPEFSEHFDLAEKDKYRHTFEIADIYRNLDEIALAKALINKYLEGLDIIRPKLKKDDVFDFAVFEQVLRNTLAGINTEFLDGLTFEFSTSVEIEKVQSAERIRGERMNKRGTADTPVQGLRLYYTYELPGKMHYLNRYTDIVLRQLVARDFRCPGYHHLYISIGDTREAALKAAIVTENWYTFGIAVLKEKMLVKSSPEQQQQLVLNAIKEGLLDIATLDGLDTTKIKEAIAAAEQADVLAERVLRIKENKKITIVISTKTLVVENEDEIWFTIIDKTSDRVARWKYGQAHYAKYLIQGWFNTITVTNKTITMRPRRMYELAGELSPIVLNVEAELNNEEKRVVIESKK